MKTAPTVVIEGGNPQWMSRKILGLPVLIRTLQSLLKAGVKLIHLRDSVAYGGILSEYNLEGVLQKDEPVEAPDLIIPANFHLDPDALSFLVNSNSLTIDQAFSTMPSHWYERLDGSEASYGRAASKLFETIRRKTEGWIAPTLNKPLSFFMTRFLVETKITPNQITFSNMILAALAAVLVAQGHYAIRLLGALMMQLSSIVDGCDGEVARLKFKFSPIGGWLDTVADDFANNVFFLGLFVGLYHSTSHLLYWRLGWVALLISLGVTFIIYHQLKTVQKSPNAKDFKPAWISQGQEKSWFDWVKPVMKRDCFIFIMMVCYILDARSFLFWISLLGIMGTFMAYFPSFLITLLRKNRA